MEPTRPLVRRVIKAANATEFMQVLLSSSGPEEKKIDI
jgi:hypothetical protein